MSPLLIARTWADDGHIAIRHKTEDARSVFSEVPNRRLSGFEQSKHEETRSALQLRSSVRSITAQFGHSVSRSLRSQDASSRRYVQFLRSDAPKSFLKKNKNFSTAD